MVLLQRKKNTFPRIQRGFRIFQRRATFSRGVQMLISIETHITFDFPGGGCGPSGSTHGHLGSYRHLRICNENRLNQTAVATHKQLVSAQP